MNLISLKTESLTYYLLQYVCTYGNQYSQEIDYLMFVDLDNLDNLDNNFSCIFKVGLNKIYKFLSSFEYCQFSINLENEIVLKCQKDGLDLNFKIYMISEEKCKKFPQLKNNYIHLNLFLHAIDSFTTIKFKKNIIENEIPKEYM